MLKLVLLTSVASRSSPFRHGCSSSCVIAEMIREGLLGQRFSPSWQE